MGWGAGQEPEVASPWLALFMTGATELVRGAWSQGGGRGWQSGSSHTSAKTRPEDLHKMPGSSKATGRKPGLAWPRAQGVFA